MSLYTQNYRSKAIFVDGDVYERRGGLEVRLELWCKDELPTLVFQDMAVVDLVGLATVALALAQHKIYDESQKVEQT